MLWLPIAILSYALNAGSLVTDKFLLAKKIPNPAVYAIVISLLGVLAVVLLPFGWRVPSFFELMIELSSGFLFGWAMLLMFSALNKGEASRVIPFLNGLQPLVILPLAWLVVGEVVSGRFLWAFILIIAGSVIISWGKGKSSAAVYVLAAASAIVFGISLVMAKYAYNSQDSFITPFVMTRLGSLIFALMLLLIPRNRRALAAELKNPKKQTGILLILGQTAGALSSILINFAVAIAHNATAIINALQGLQYVFLLAIVVFLSKKFPKILKEKITGAVLAQKIVATALIIAGLIVLAF
ncbi:MAG: hypothetical protein WC517_00660 [Patescibacteria group bacterium]